MHLAYRILRAVNYENTPRMWGEVGQLIQMTSALIKANNNHQIIQKLSLIGLFDRSTINILFGDYIYNKVNVHLSVI